MYEIENWKKNQQFCAHDKDKREETNEHSRDITRRTQAGSVEKLQSITIDAQAHRHTMQTQKIKWDSEQNGERGQASMKHWLYGVPYSNWTDEQKKNFGENYT